MDTTEDKQRFELCCIPFFTYGLSLGDVISIDSRLQVPQAPAPQLMP